MAPKVKNRSPPSDLNGMFSGLRVFLIETAVKPRRLQIWKQKLVQMGAKIEDSFSRRVTHIFAADLNSVLQKMDGENLKRFKGKVLNYQWLEDSLRIGEKASEDLYILSADAGGNYKSKVAEEKNHPKHNNANHSSIEDRHPQKKIKTCSEESQIVGLVEGDHVSVDVLDYSSEMDTASGSSHSSQSLSPDIISPNLDGHKKAASLSDTSLLYSPPDLNRNITEIFGKLINIYRALGDDRRSFSYYKAIPVIEKVPFRIESADQVKDLPGIGKSLQDHIQEIVNTGKLSKLKHFEKDEKVHTINLFGEVWGIGPATAVKLYEKGYRTLDDLKTEESLTNAQKLGLKYYDDIKTRIPRHEVQEMESLMQKVGEEILPGVVIVCGGSYRRGKASCGDMDIVIMHPDGRSQAGDINKYFSSSKQVVVDKATNLLVEGISEKLDEGKVGGDNEFGKILPNVHKEQISLIICCLDDSQISSKIEEYWVHFLEVCDTSGLGLFTHLQNTLITLGLDIDDIRGQGYDNVSNMKGRHKGVQRRLLEVNLKSFFTPCGCHSLNLTLCDMANSCPKAMSFFGVVQRIYTLFSSSTKRWKIFKNHVRGLTVKPLSQTRWESHVESVKAIKEQIVQIKDALLDLTDDTEDPNTKSEAESLVLYEFENFEFLLSVVIWYKLLHVINIVSKFLQSETMDIDTAIKLLQGVILFLEEYREHGFDEAMSEATEMASQVGIEVIFREKRIVRRKKQFDESGTEGVTQTAEESYRVTYFLYIVDQARSSIKIRFEQFKKYEETFGFLLNLERLRDIDDESLLRSCKNLQGAYTHNGVSDIDGDDLFTELDFLKHVLSKEAKSTTEVINYLKEMDGCFPNTYIAYKILLTIPVTVASAERSFSKLKLIKTFLRSTMSQDRLNGLAMLSIEKELAEQIDYADIINTFATKVRRVVFL
ncbi:hypothetical protein OROGR_001445 [Orobanche gracilis]